MLNSHSYQTIAVVVVLSREFLGKQHPMEEVRQIVQQRKAGSHQRLCIVLHGITYEECSQHVLPEYAADLKTLLGVTALRGDQASAMSLPNIYQASSCSLQPICWCARPHSWLRVDSGEPL